jgi:hypothetical protein
LKISSGEDADNVVQLGVIGREQLDYLFALAAGVGHVAMGGLGGWSEPESDNQSRLRRDGCDEQSLAIEFVHNSTPVKVFFRQVISSSAIGEFS